LSPPVLKLVAVLSVDTGTWLRNMTEPEDADWCGVVSDENGFFGCVGLVGCHDVEPKGLPLLDQCPYLRRKELGTSLR